MKTTALVVEDNEDIAERVMEILDSLGHEYVWARSQEDARPPIAEGGFDYVLLDLAIPVRTQRGLDSIEYGANLAKEMHQSPAMQGVPIIVMTAYGKEGLEIAASLCEHGVVDFINKPFPQTGRTLVSVIQSAVDRSRRRQKPGEATADRPKTDFRGGELVFHPDRVELCNVTVASSSKSAQIWAILDTLKERLNETRFRAFPGSALAGKGGQGSVAGSIRDFRRNVSERLGQELDLNVKSDDVIETFRSGYRLRDWIVVKDLRGSGCGKTASAGQPSTEDADLDRQQRIVEMIRAGEHLRVPDFAKRLHCSQSTAKRAVDVLKTEGRIEFTGAPKSGYYKLVANGSLVGVPQ